ncbi:MAG: pyruvate ferredoxin oxidoreductase [Candidatus Neomarinimicrobiota bacterium]|nr:MAG: pyruvate ferredoxin oxidoreductase [Candidatus Neomarinimicrobiota bacterium]
MLVIEGTHAASHAARLARVQAISAYPITPQTSIVELLSEMCATGDLDAQFIKVESEHSALACLVGAASAGARCFTATSSQGLLLMHEIIHWVAAARLPIVMVNVNRALAPPWSIWADQTDSLAQRDTGWIQFYGESNQEILDTILMAYRLAEQVMLPVMVNMDAFFLSHTAEPVALPKQELVDRFLPPYQPEFRLDVNHPRAFGGLAKPDVYMEFRYHMQQAMEEALQLWPVIAEEYKYHLGRWHGTAIESYRCEDAETILVTAGTITGTTRLVVDQYRENGVPLGLVKIRMFRPFPVEALRQALAQAQRVGVIDRNLSFGQGGIFYSELKSALYNGDHRPLLNGYVAGLGGRDVTPDVLAEIVEHLIHSETGQDLVWIGVKA